MLSIDEPSITGAQRPTISDAKSCQQWLAALPLTNAPAAHTEIQLQLDLLNHTSALSGIERWRILEHLRESIQFVQGEVAKKYAGKPAPLEGNEIALWKKTLTLWQSFNQGYQICLQNYLDNDKALASFAPAIVQRILRLTGQQMLEYYNLYQNVPEALWKQLHKAYASAEALGVEKTPVKDPLNRMVEGTRPESAYVQALLMDLADPFHYNIKQRSQIDRWLDKWAARVIISKTPSAPHPELKLPVLVVDLNRTTGIQYGMPFEASATVRHLDINLLAATLAKRIRHLRKGGAPGELDMGDDCQQPACEALLTQLYQQWCEPPQNRTYERRTGGEKAQVSFTIAAIHFFCNGGKPFRQPGEREHQDIGWREAQDLKIFGQVSSQTKKLQASQIGFAVENWQIQDESALGFKLAADGLHAARVALNQLVAIRHPQAKHFAIGMIRWMRFDPNGDLSIGIRAFPGIPMAIGIRAPVLIASLQNKFLQGFLLPEIPALKEPATLVLPHGWYGPNKQLELHIDATLMVRLSQVIERGIDFERVTFSLK
jgi:hypothetical protein